MIFLMNIHIYNMFYICTLYTIGVNRPAIVREILHFGVFPAFLPERPAFLGLFRNNKNR